MLNRLPKIDSFLKYHPTSEYIKFEVNTVVTFPYNGRKPRTQGQIIIALSWWRHQMETFSALLAICAGNSPVPGEFPEQRPVTRSFDVFFDLRLNKLLSKQSWGWWFETLSRPLWRHRNDSARSGQLSRGSLHKAMCKCHTKRWWIYITWRRIPPDGPFVRGTTGHRIRTKAQKTERSSGWQPRYSPETLNASFNVSSKYQGCPLTTVPFLWASNAELLSCLPG